MLRHFWLFKSSRAQAPKPAGNHPFLDLHILQLQMPWQTGHIQLGFFLTSNTFSPYLHQQQSVNPETN